MNDPRFHDDTVRGRYRLLLDDDELGFIEYDRVGETSILIKHTEVLPGHEGKGYASTLVQAALDHIRGQGKSVIPICTYTMNWVRKHPGYHDLVPENLRRTL